ncbi:MAG TPA: hypothetical protein VNC78_01545 [Actinomycetota bacterium]|nr:hypothetical protein [Actinomycetota bacterium]
MRVRRGLLVAVLMVQMLPLAHASAAKESPRQEEEGVILVGTPDCSYTRTIYLLGGEATHEVFTYRFDVDPKTWQRPFVLEPRPGIEVTGTDLMVTFLFGDLGTPGDVLSPPPFVTYLNDPGGEKGIVPNGATDAFIQFCQGSSVPTTHPSGGLQAGFHYLAEGPKKPL